MTKISGLIGLSCIEIWKSEMKSEWNQEIKKVSSNTNIKLTLRVGTDRTLVQLVYHSTYWALYESFKESFRDLLDIIE